MDNDEPQDLFVKVGTSYRSFSGMSKNDVLTLLPGFGATADNFIDEETYLAGTTGRSWPPS